MTRRVIIAGTDGTASSTSLALVAAGATVLVW